MIEIPDIFLNTRKRNKHVVLLKMKIKLLIMRSQSFAGGKGGKMDKEFLMTQSQTAQVRIFALDLLADHGLHSRQELVRHVEELRQLYGLPEYSTGQIAGGLQQATQNCEKPGRGSFRLPASGQDSTGEMEIISRSQTARQIIDEAIGRLSALARQIDYINASAEETQELQKLKACVIEMKKLREQFPDT